MNNSPYMITSNELSPQDMVDSIRSLFYMLFTSTITKDRIPHKVTVPRCDKVVALSYLTAFNLYTTCRTLLLNSMSEHDRAIMLEAVLRGERDPDFALNTRLGSLPPP